MIIAMGFALFGLAVKYLPIFPEEGHAAKGRERSKPDLLFRLRC